MMSKPSNRLQDITFIVSFVLILFLIIFVIEDSGCLIPLACVTLPALVFVFRDGSRRSALQYIKPRLKESIFFYDVPEEEQLVLTLKPDPSLLQEYIASMSPIEIGKLASQIRPQN